MNVLTAMNALRRQGLVVSAPDYAGGKVRLWIPDSGEGVEVHLSGELIALAEGRIRIEDLDFERNRADPDSE